MKGTDIALRRLFAQGLAGEPFEAPLEAVSCLGAVQSQDYAGAKWALGQRTRAATDAGLDRLFDEGVILRTHVMRGTWHFVLPEDIRWLLELTAPRVKAAMAANDRAWEIDGPLVARSGAVLERTLADARHLTRAELAAAMESAGIAAAGLRLTHILMHAELDGLIVSGPRQGRQHTYAPFDERVPKVRRLDREEALAELTRRYFIGRGPAQVTDFAWWSGLTVKEARRGLDMVGSCLEREVVEGKTYWSSANAPPARKGGPAVHLLPNFDEFLVAYQDRSASFDPSRGLDLTGFRNGVLDNVVVLRGQVWGGWKRRLEGRQAVVEVGPVDALEPSEAAELEQAAGRLGRFLGVPVTARLPSA